MSTTYLITGGAGFIGSHLVDALLAAGHTVLAIDDLSTGRRANIGHVEHHERFHFARASITDKTVMDRMASQADVIIHLAAAVGVNLVVEHPVHTIENNVMGTEAVLQVARRYSSRVLIASTSEVYGKGARVPFHEDDDILLGATSKNRWGYAASKMVDEFLALAYASEFGLDVTCFRLFNTVGPRQTGRYGMVIPQFVSCALANQPIRVFGDGSQRRCFCHVRDVVRAIIGLAESTQARGTVVNIGGTEEISIMDLARLIKDLTASAAPIELVPYDQAYAPGFEDMLRRVPDIGRVHGLIGWEPRSTLVEILHDVIAHTRQEG